LRVNLGWVVLLGRDFKIMVEATGHSCRRELMSRRVLIAVESRKGGLRL
jgi:hypothetical protein